MSERFSEVCPILGIQRTSTTLVKPEWSAIIERTNGTFEGNLSKYVDDLHHDWTIYLRLKLMTYRFSVHAATKARFLFTYNHL